MFMILALTIACSFIKNYIFSEIMISINGIEEMDWKNGVKAIECSICKTTFFSSKLKYNEHMETYHSK